MKKVVLFLVVSLFSGLLCAEESIQLPEPDKKGSMPLAQALAGRKTIRKYSARDLSRRQLSDLLWAANGVSRPDGKRTAPTAANRQELELYVLTAKGAWHYQPMTHQLKKITSEDLRAWAGRFKAPVYLVIAADMKKAASDHYASMDTGYVSQNIYLHCAANGMGTCAIGSFARIKDSGNGKKLHDGLKLSDNMKIELTHSVGMLN